MAFRIIWMIVWKHLKMLEWIQEVVHWILMAMVSLIILIYALGHQRELKLMISVVHMILMRTGFRITWINVRIRLMMWKLINMHFRWIPILTVYRTISISALELYPEC